MSEFEATSEPHRSRVTPRETPSGVAAGTLILTTLGKLPAEALRAGDRVIDANGVTHVVRGVRRLSCNGPLVRIHAGALASSMPTSDLLVGPAQRISITCPQMQLMFGRAAGLALARDLLGCGADPVAAPHRLDMIGIRCGAPAILWANGTPVLCPGRASTPAPRTNGEVRNDNQ
ncbi:Hint domain-containing protein [Roseicyclus sp. F158]|uniref:Hint domain-containing protein n=1 Tax=Tropicimonas omnivorans TaxID=3075590 RepID=A0ABU3DEE5_9RHOB|nr:Hint domain-containing protein [Roseicyclus sp. F158]MDT0682050.1 Hint domain-containing protein [Roseicyclus sp. F158]